MRPAVTVYNSPVLSSEPSSRCPVQPLRAGPSSPAEPVVLRQPIPQPLRAGPSGLTAREWEPCGPLASNRSESFPSLTGFLTGRRWNITGRPRKAQYGTSVHERICEWQSIWPSPRAAPAPSCRARHAQLTLAIEEAREEWRAAADQVGFPGQPSVDLQAGLHPAVLQDSFERAIA
jgi:hypothetical protein